MPLTKINSADMRRNNYNTVLDAIRFSAGISRKAIADAVGLTSATITNIVSDLIREGYVKETGLQESAGGGRKGILLSVNPEACYAVGIDLSRSDIVSVVTDFEAGIRAKRIAKIDTVTMDRESVITAMIDNVEEVIAGSGVPRSEIRGIGLTTPGPIDIERGLIINPTSMESLWNVPIRDIVSERTGYPVFFEQHMNAAALCETWMGRAHDSKCMFLCGVLEAGVGGAVMIDGKLHYGSGNVAGEIGHMSVDPNGPVCPVCGKHGCLEPLAEGRALLDRVRARIKADPERMAQYGISDASTIDTDFITGLAEQGESPFREEIIRSAGYVGQALANVVTVLSPDTIVLTGDLADKSPLYVKTVSDIIRSLKYPEEVHNIEVYATKFRRFVNALGGVTMVLNSVCENL